jgi:hypothetical protein
MNINAVQPMRSLQNAALPLERSNAAFVDAAFSSVGQIGVSASSTESRTPQIHAQGITTFIDSIQEQLDLILVHYPPFFPIGTYQRLDLIQKIKGIQEEVEGSSIDEGIKKTFSGVTLKDDATDEDISAALDKLFGLRDALMKDDSISHDKLHPGSILNMKA